VYKIDYNGEIIKNPMKISVPKQEKDLYFSFIIIKIITDEI